jgi:hypothetical protein
MRDWDGNKPPVCKVLVSDSSLCYRNKDRRANETTDCSGASQKLAPRCRRDLQDRTSRAGLVCTQRRSQMPTTQLCLAAVVARREDSSMSITHADLSASTWAVVLAAGDGARLSRDIFFRARRHACQCCAYRNVVGAILALRAALLPVLVAWPRTHGIRTSRAMPVW